MFEWMWTCHCVISLQSPAVSADGSHSTPPPRPQRPSLPSTYCTTDSTARHKSEVRQRFTPHLWSFCSTQYFWHLDASVFWLDQLGWRLWWCGELWKVVLFGNRSIKNEMLRKHVLLQPHYATVCLWHPGCRTCRQTCSSSSTVALLPFPVGPGEWRISCTGTGKIYLHMREKQPRCSKTSALMSRKLIRTRLFITVVSSCEETPPPPPPVVSSSSSSYLSLLMVFGYSQGLSNRFPRELHASGTVFIVHHYSCCCQVHHQVLQ